MDLNRPTLHGLKAARRRTAGWPKAEILIVTSYHSLEATRIAAVAQELAPKKLMGSCEIALGLVNLPRRR